MDRTENLIILLLIAAGTAAAVALVRYRCITKVEACGADWLKRCNFAHRGLHDDALPENSLPAFEKAAGEGYAIELDVRMTLDRKLVVFHDAHLRRMTGAPGRVGRKTLASLKRLRLLGSGERIPTLREVLELVDGRVPILFELKSIGLSGALERRFCEEVQGYGGAFAVQSFSPWSLRWIRRYAPHIPRGQLAGDMWFCSEGMNRLKRSFLRLVSAWMRHMETNFVSRPNFISYEYHDVCKKAIARLRRRGALVLAWTVRDEQQWQGARPYADAVIFENIRPAA